MEKYYVHQCPKLKNGDGVKKELLRIYPYFEGRYLDELSDVAREYIEAERSPVAGQHQEQTVLPASRLPVRA